MEYSLQDITAYDEYIEEKWKAGGINVEQLAKELYDQKSLDSYSKDFVREYVGKKIMKLVQ